MNEWINTNPQEGRHSYSLSPFPCPGPQKAHPWPFSTGHCLPSINHLLCPAGKASQCVPQPLPLRPGNREPQKQVPRQCLGPKSWLWSSREQSLVLPTHRLHRAAGALAGRRENPDQNRQGGGPGKRLLATTLLISVSINLYDTLETSEREQSRLEKKRTDSGPGGQTVAGPGAGNAGVSWDSAARQTVAARGRPCLSLTAAGAGLLGQLLLWQGPNSKAQSCSRERKISRFQTSPGVMRPWA